MVGDPARRPVRLGACWSGLFVNRRDDWAGTCFHGRHPNERSTRVNFREKKMTRADMHQAWVRAQS